MLICIAAALVGAAPAARAASQAPAGGVEAVGFVRPAAAAPRTARARAVAQRGGWIAALGGFALGGLVGVVFGGGGFGGVALFIVIAALIGYAAFTLYRLSRQGNRSVPASPAALSALASTRAAAGPATPREEVDPGREAALVAARLGFVKLQLADELNEPERLRALTTTEMFAELARQRVAPTRARPVSEIVGLRVEPLEFSGAEGTREARVLLSGTRRDAEGATLVPFRQTWRLVQSRDDAQRWLLAQVEPAP